MLSVSVYMRPRPLPPYLTGSGSIIDYLKSKGADEKIRAERANDLAKAEAKRAELGFDANVKLTLEYFETRSVVQSTLNFMQKHFNQEWPGCSIESLSDDTILVKRDGVPIEIRQFLVCSLHSQALSKSTAWFI